MRFSPAAIPGAWRISLEPHADARGFFARTFCEREFAAAGLVPRFVQCNLSANKLRGTLRGMHFQRPPSQEAKVVRCIHGSIYDVILDLRPDSPAFRKWEAFELSAANRESLYIPAGCAHGFQSLENDTEVFYLMSDFHGPELAGGVRWNDPAFSILWPIADPILSDKDRDYPDVIR